MSDEEKAIRKARLLQGKQKYMNQIQEQERKARELDLLKEQQTYLDAQQVSKELKNIRKMLSSYDIKRKAEEPVAE